MTATAQSTTFGAWLDRFFDAYYRNHPVNATFIGVHAFDHGLPDLSTAGTERLIADADALLHALSALPEEHRSDAEQIDRQLAEGALEIARWEASSAQFGPANASRATGEAVFGIMSLLLRPFAPLDERLESVLARLHGIPSLLSGACESVASPSAWKERARRECDGLDIFLTDGLLRAIPPEHPLVPAISVASQGARRAVADFRGWLEHDLPNAPEDTYSAGVEALELLVRRGHFLDTSPGDVLALAEDRLAETAAWLREHARDFDETQPEAVLARLAAIHPSQSAYLGRYGDLLAESREVAERENLLTWPDFPLEFVPRPEWADPAAAYLYFLFYRSPAAFDRVLPVRYLVTPIRPDMPAQEQDRLLRANNESVIKLNHVVHHGGIGHHVQNWHAFRAASRIGQIAAVDCASRIALFCGGTMAEGWACYATELMEEAGFLTPLEEYAEQHTRMRMAARAIADIRLHTGAWSLPEVEALYRDRVGMSAPAAHAEAVKNSMFPGTALMYLAGADRIHRLRSTLERRHGAEFRLGSFHDRLLSYGSIPVAMAAQRMEVQDAL